MIYESITDMIGNTPLLRIDETVHGIANLTLYAKLEMMNPFGSVKDRIAKSMLLPDLERIKAEGLTVIESSSGNTAKALSALCSMHNVPFVTVTNRIKLPEIRETITYLNAQIIELPGLSECPDPSQHDNPLAIIKQMKEREPKRYYDTDQYFNPRNVEAHRESGREIHEDLGDIDYFFADLGTCGTSVGIGSYLREHQKKKPNIIGVVTEEGSYAPGGRNENELYETFFFKKDFYEGIVKSSTQEAIEGMKTLAHSSGLLCGPTTGLIYSALKKWFEEHPLREPSTAVFIACDRLEPYNSYLKQHSPKRMLGTQETQATAMTTQETNDALLIDTRTNLAFRLGHIPGSVNIPTHLIEQMIGTGPSFPKDKRIVLVCPVGEQAKPHAAALRDQGYDAYVLEGGIAKWREEQEACRCEGGATHGVTECEDP